MSFLNLRSLKDENLQCKRTAICNSSVTIVWKSSIRAWNVKKKQNSEVILSESFSAEMYFSIEEKSH